MNAKVIVWVILAILALPVLAFEHENAILSRPSTPSGGGSRTTWAVTNTAEFEAACAGAGDGDTINMASANYTLTANLILSKILTIHGDNPAGVIIYTAGGIGLSTTKTLVIDNVTIIGGGRSALSIYAGGTFFKVTDCNIRAWATSGTTYGIASAVIGSIDRCIVSIDTPGGNGYGIQLNTTMWVNKTYVYVNATINTCVGIGSAGSVSRWINDTYIKVRMTTGSSLACWQSYGYSNFDNVTVITESTSAYYVYNFGANHFVNARNCHSIVNNSGGGGAAGPMRGFATGADYTSIYLYNCSVELNAGTYNQVMGVQATRTFIENCTINVTQGATNYNAYGILGGSRPTTTPSSTSMHGVVVQNTTVNMICTGGTLPKYGIASYAALTTNNVSVSISTTTDIPTVAFVNPFTVEEPYAITATNCTANVSAINGTAFSSLREYVNLVNCTLQSNSTGNFTPIRYMGTIPFNTSGNFSGNLNFSTTGPSATICDINTTNLTAALGTYLIRYGNATNLTALGDSNITFYQNRTGDITTPLALSWILGANDYSLENSTDTSLTLLQMSQITASTFRRMNSTWTAAFSGTNYNASVLNASGVPVASQIDIQNRTISWTGPIENYALYTDPRNPYTGPSFHNTTGIVTPSVGINTTTFQFLVGVTNICAPLIAVNVSVDGVAHVMNDTGAGLYRWNSTFGIGNHSFNISITDGTNTTTSPNSSFQVLPVDFPPVLSDSMVLPDHGTDLDTYTFVTSAYDPEGSNITVSLVLDGTSHNMTAVGLVYYYSTSLAAGTYIYAFEADDGTSSTVSPDASLTVTASPVVLWGRVLEGVNLIPGITVEAHRIATDQYLTTTTDLLGQFSINCTAGWPTLADTEWVELSAANTLYSGSVSVQVDRLNDPGQHDIQIYPLVPIYQMSFVVTLDGAPASGAVVQVTDGSGVDLVPTATDAFGHASLPVAEGGYSYIVTVGSSSATGFLAMASNQSVNVALSSSGEPESQLWLYVAMGAAIGLVVSLFFIVRLVRRR